MKELFEIDHSIFIPEILDDLQEEKKMFYVKVNCKSKEEVREIVNVFENLNIEKKRITVSA